MDLLSKTLLKTILSLPTMSFHETAISTFVRWYAAGLGLSIEEDRAGNLLVSYRGKKRSQGSVTFTAHMDHPGFEVLTARGRKATVALCGKVDARIFCGSSVRIHGADATIKGVIGARALTKQDLERPTFTLTAESPVQPGDFGTFDLPSVTFSGKRIRALAADNLISVTAILDLLTRFAKGKVGVNVRGLFTRGEEVGFLGALAALESGIIPKQDPLIVLECSSASGGGVKIGGGPVVRAGDLQSTYDPAVDVWVSEVAAKIAGQQQRFQFQRALLQGGRCEAAVYIAEGCRVGGIAMPLGNYHNCGKRGPVAEYVDQEDYRHYITLLAALAHHAMPSDALRKRIAPMKKHYRTLKRKLMASR